MKKTKNTCILKKTIQYRFLLSLFLCVFFSYNIQAQLAGIYTIGGATPDFATINDAINAVETSGVSGPVIMNIRPGIYYEQFSIDAISGISPSNTLTLKSETNNAADVVIQKDNALPANYVMQINQTSNIFIRHLTFTVLQAHCSWGLCDARVIYLADVNDIAISDCILNGYNLGSNSGSGEVISALSTSYMNNISIVRNKISYGTRGFALSSSSFATSNFLISDNEFLEQGSVAISFNGAHNTDKIINNKIVNSNTTGYGNYAILINYCTHTLKIMGNTINIATSPWTSGSGVIDLVGCHLPISDGGLIANNWISVSLTNGVGLSLETCDNISVQHNNFLVKFESIIVDENGTTCNNIEIINNNFKTTNGYIIVGNSVASVSTTFSNIDYNNYYIDGTGLIFQGTYLINCLAQSNAIYGFDSHSISVDPLYNSDADLHAQNIMLKDGGINMGVAYDIDSVLRNTPRPSIGANEIVQFQSPLSGTYTIGATGHFTTINQALDSLNTLGINNNVTFELQPGTYTTPLVLGKVAGLNNPYFLTFQSTTHNASDVIWTSSGSPIITLENVNNIKFQYITFQTLSGSSGSHAITLLNELKNIHFTNNIFNFNSGQDVIYSEINKCIHYSKTDSLIIENNQFIGGRNNINLTGGSLINHSTNSTIINNSFSSFYGDAITLKYQKNAIIEADSMNAANSKGIYLIKCSEKTQVNKNKIIGVMTGIILDSCFSSLGNEALVSNNFINAGPPFGYGVYALKLNQCTNQQIFHNSINLIYNAMSFGGNTCFYSHASKSCKVYNNIFNGQDWLFDIDSLNHFNFNDFNTPEPQIGRYNGTIFGTLASFISGTGTNAQSIQIDPIYTSSSDLHTNNLGLKLPNYLNTVAKDIDGVIRHTIHPFIGATEICKQPIASFISDTICFGDTVVFLNNSSNIDPLSVFYWDYENTGDIDTNSFANVSYYYPLPLTYHPELIILNPNGCSDTISQTLIVTDTTNLPVAFGSTISGDTVSFSDNTANSTTWYWDFGDGFFSTSQNPTHIYSGPGSFYVCRTDINNCATAIFCDSITILAPLSIPESFSDESIIVFPNPSSDKTTIIFNNQTRGLVCIYLYNNLGELIYRKMDYSDDKLELNVNELSNGVYQLLITSKTNDNVLTKLIINK